MFVVQFLVAYLSFSVVVPVSVLALCVIYRLIRPRKAPMRDCRYCGAVIPVESMSAYCSSDCDHRFQQVRQDILVQASGQAVQRAV